MRRLIAAVAMLVALVGATGCTRTLPDSPEPMGSAPGAPSAGEATSTLIVEDPWVRATTGAKDASMTAAFMTIVNPGDFDVNLIGADYAGAGMVQVHEMVMKDGAMAMQEAKDGAPVPAGSHLHLAPGGYHVMLMILKDELAVGDEVNLTLHFSDESSLQVTALVKEFVEEEDHYHSPMPSPSTAS